MIGHPIVPQNRGHRKVLDLCPKDVENEI